MKRRTRQDSRHALTDYLGIQICTSQNDVLWVKTASTRAQIYSIIDLNLDLHLFIFDEQ